MKAANDSFLFNARVYQSGSSTSQPFKIGVEDGEIFLTDRKGTVVDELQGDDWNLSLGGTNDERVVLKHTDLGHTIVTDLEFLNVLAAGTNFPHLTDQARKLKKGSFGRSVGRSSGMIGLAVMVLLFIGWIVVGFSFRGSDRLNKQTSDTGVEDARQHSVAAVPAESDGQAYMRLISPVIKEKWSPPRSAKHLSTVVRFSISREGHISDAHISQSSGDEDFDKLGLMTLKKVKKLPPLPESVQAPAAVEFTFAYNQTREKHNRVTRDDE